jgi:hypothetical protein
VIQLMFAVHQAGLSLGGDALISRHLQMQPRRHHMLARILVP